MSCGRDAFLGDQNQVAPFTVTAFRLAFCGASGGKGLVGDGLVGFRDGGAAVGTASCMSAVSVILADEIVGQADEGKTVVYRAVHRPELQGKV